MVKKKKVGLIKKTIKIKKDIKKKNKSLKVLNVKNLTKKNKLSTKIIKKNKVIKKSTKISSKKLIRKVAKTIKKKLIKKKVLNKKLILRKNKVIKQKDKKSYLKLDKAKQNPIIEPRNYSWESKATFNPTAFYKNGKIHLIYRAIGDNDNSVLGYASSFNGYYIQERPTYNLYKRYIHSNKIGPKISYSSGGGLEGGCEDPRVTLIGDTVYVLYNGFDGWSSVRIIMISMSLNDFRNKKWNNWSDPIYLSPEGDIQKAWALFPEKINGKYAILYELWPYIHIQYFDSFDEFKEEKIKIKQHWNRWYTPNNPKDWVMVHSGTDGQRLVDPEKLKKNIWSDVEDKIWIRNIAGAPIRTKEGWLVLYHAIESKNPGKYKLFAMLLDLKDPTIVLYKSDEPILEPEEAYEYDGWRGIIYSCGAVIKDGRLFVYYGGGDKVVGVASIKLEELLISLKKHTNIKLKKPRLLKIIKKIK